MIYEVFTPAGLVKAEKTFCVELKFYVFQRTNFRFSHPVMSQITDDNKTLDFLHPLHGERTRTGAVTAQLAGLRGLSRAAVLRRAAERGKDRRLERETLIAVVRGFLRAGDRDAADAVLVILIDRVSSAIAAKTSAWAKLKPDEKQDARREMVAILCEKVCDLRPGAEFWECNFTSCFNRASISLWRSLTDHALPTVANTVEMSGGAALDRLDQLADPADALADVEMDSLVALVSGGSAKRSEALFLKLNGFSDEDIAVRLGVTSRTLRNWTAEACATWNRLQREQT